MLCQVDQVTYSGHWFCHKKNPPFISLYFILVTVIWFVDQTLLNTHRDKIRVLVFLGFDAMPFSKWLLTFEGSQCLHLRNLAVLLELLHSKNEDTVILHKNRNHSPSDSLSHPTRPASSAGVLWKCHVSHYKFLYHHECNSELPLYAPSCIQNNKLHCTLQSMRLLGTIHTQNWLHHYLKVVHKKKTEFVHVHFCIQSGVCFMFLCGIILPPSQRT